MAIFVERRYKRFTKSADRYTKCAFKTRILIAFPGTFEINICFDRISLSRPALWSKSLAQVLSWHCLSTHSRNIPAFDFFLLLVSDMLKSMIVEVIYLDKMQCKNTIKTSNTWQSKSKKSGLVLVLLAFLSTLFYLCS